MTLFDHQQKESSGQAPLRTTRPLLPVQTPATLADDLVRIVPQAVKGGTPAQLNQTLDAIKGLQDAWGLQKAAKEYEQRTGRVLLNDLLDVFEPWIDVKRDVALILQGLIPNLTWHAFLEQVAYGVAYAQEDDISDAKGGGEQTNMKALVKAAGFQPGPLIRGRWGLQFRSLNPMPNAIRQMHIVTFRGTEGVKMPWQSPTDPATREGMVDTWIGDMTRMGAGYPQYLTNKALIERNLGANKHSAVTGHSLGGGLAQIALAMRPDLVSECVTFNAPGIKKEDAAALKDKQVPTTHYRTTFDIVPTGNSKAAPGTIYTFDRLTPARGGNGWLRDESITTTHNHMPLNGMLNYEDAGNLTPLQQKMRTTGVNGPAAADQQDRAVSTLISARPTSQDRILHAGEVGPFPDAIQKTFAANLGYNLLVEYAQTRIADMNPAKQTPAAINQQLAQLVTRLRGLEKLPVTVEAAKLYAAIGFSGPMSRRATAPFAQGTLTSLSKDDRDAVALQVRAMWVAWWPGGFK